MPSNSLTVRPPEAAPAREPLSLRHWLVLLGLLLTLPMFVVEWSGARHEQALLIERGRHDSQQYADTIAVSQEQFLAGIGQLLAAIGASPAASEGRQQCLAYFQRLLQQQPWVANLGLLDDQGRLSCSALGGGGRYAQEPMYRRARDENLLTVSEYLAGPLSGKPVLGIGRPVRTADGRFRAVAFAAVDLRWMGESLRLQGLPAGAQAFLADAGGLVLAASGAGQARQTGLPLPDPALRQALLERRAGLVAPGDPALIRVLRPIHVAGRPGLYVALAVPSEAVTPPGLRGTPPRLLMLTAVALSLAALCWLFGDRWLVRPLRQVLRSLRHAQRGDYATALAEPGRQPREFMALGRAVARLAQTLDEQRRTGQQTLQALRESEASYRALFESTPLPLWVLDSASQRFLAVNAAAALHYGYPIQTFLAMTLDDIQPPGWQTVDGDVPAIRPHRKHSGEVCQMQVSSQPMQFEGRPARLCMALDVTQNLAAQERVREVNANLERLVTERARELELSNRELEAFSYSVSHDLRNPLHAIAMFSELLADHDGCVLDAQARLYLDRIQEGTCRMEALIDDLLALARVTQAELVMAPVDLSALAHEVVQELRTQQPGRAVEVQLARGLRCVGDVRLLRQVLANLLGNAWKFTGRTPAPRIELGLQQSPGEAACFYVADNGAGFDAAQAERVFEPFQRLHDEQEYPGSGVGLASVRRIVARHSGRIWCSAAEGQGASFYVVLPGLVQQL